MYYGIPCISNSFVIYTLSFKLGRYRIDYVGDDAAAVSNARLMFSYTTNVIIVPGRTRTIDATSLSSQWD